LNLFKAKSNGIRKKKLGVLISGTGSNLLAILKSIKKDKICADVTVVLSNIEDAAGIDKALGFNIPAYFIDPKRFANRIEYDLYLADKFKEYECDFIVLAGYMRILSPEFVDRFPNSIVNIHPSLLPAFPGLKAQRQAIEFGSKISGCTVHFVDKELDHGPIILQRAVKINDNDTERSLSKRIIKQEHLMYAEALALLCDDKLVIRNRSVKLVD
jgi:phosphoribosylglycinamide formyltransferase 1